MESVEHITFDNARGQPLVGLLHVPGGATPETGVVIAHGMLSSKDSDKHRKLCEALAEQGHLALRFDFSGRGESKSVDTELSFTSDLDDLRRALGFLRKHGASRLGLVGSSMGGAASIHVAPMEPDVVAVVTAAAPAYLHNRPSPNWTATWIEKIRQLERFEAQPGLFVSPNLFEDLAQYDSLVAAEQIRVPWLILHGQFDELIPITDAEALAAANPAARLEVHPESDHRFSRQEWRDWMVERAAQFLDQVL